jgi:hypothetical protein
MDQIDQDHVKWLMVLVGLNLRVFTTTEFVILEHTVAASVTFIYYLQI